MDLPGIVPMEQKECRRRRGEREESVGRQECDFQFGERRTFGLLFGGGWRREAASGRPDQAGRAFGAFGAFGRSLLAPAPGRA